MSGSFGVGAPGTIASASGSNILAFNTINTTPQQVLGADVGRTKITFHNPGAVVIFIAPVYVQNSGSDVALIPTNTALGGCWTVLANGGTLVMTGEISKPFQAFSVSGATNPLSIQVDHV